MAAGGRFQSGNWSLGAENKIGNSYFLPFNIAFLMHFMDFINVSVHV